ncbi:MAG: lptG [Gammaproteobacteria bacterium]|jgi:lipopolysaccharide export system permease protein|nr:lptG [Gammaproteobacteria bacterium]
MNILQRYIAKGVLTSTLLVFLVVVALSFIVGLLKELHDMGVGEYGFGHAVIYVLLQLPHTLYQFFPLLVLLGGVLGLGLLAASHELMVMRTSGASVRQIVWGVIGAALLMIFLMMLVGEGIGPRAEYLAEKRKSSAMSNGQAVATRSGIWIHQGNNFLHAERIVGHYHLEGVTRYEFNDKHLLLASYYAKSLDFIKGQWLLHDLVKTTLKGNRTQSEAWAETTWDLILNPTLLNSGIMEPESMSLLRLAKYAHSLEKNHLQSSSFALEFWQRVFQPLAILVMILLAIPFVFTAPRAMNIGRRMLLAIMAGFIFYILAALIGQFSIVFQLPPFIAALVPILLFGGAGYMVMLKIKG